MPYDASNQRHVTKAEKASKVADAQAASFVRVAMSTIEGRAWFLRFLERCYIFTTPFTGNANATAFNCGVQSRGLEILTEIIAYAPDAYILMMRERNDRLTSPDDRQRGRNADGNGRDSPDPEPGGTVDSDYSPTERASAED